MPYRIEYLASVVKDDIPALDAAARRQIRAAIESRLARNPIEVGKPLQYSLRGCRRLRVGDYRVIFQIEGTVVVIVKIGHRREVYGG